MSKAGMSLENVLRQKEPNMNTCNREFMFSPPWPVVLAAMLVAADEAGPTPFDEHLLSCHSKKCKQPLSKVVLDNLLGLC
jgi:hypothetical protein